MCVVRAPDGPCFGGFWEKLDHSVGTTRALTTPMPALIASFKMAFAVSTKAGVAPVASRGKLQVR